MAKEEAVSGPGLRLFEGSAVAAPLFIARFHSGSEEEHAARRRLEQELQRLHARGASGPGQILVDPAPFEIIPLEPRAISLADFLRHPRS